MNPRLIPYTWVRHVVPALLAASAAVVAWWASVVGLDAWRQLSWMRGGTGLSPGTEGMLWLSLIAAATASAQIAFEAVLERPWKSLAVVGVCASGVFALSGAALGIALHDVIAARLGMPSPTLALRWHLGPWIVTGVAAASGPWMVRTVRRVLEWAQVRWDLRALPTPPPPASGWLSQTALHLASGLAGGCVGALVWYNVGQADGDLFVASAAGSWSMAAVVGGLNWGIPARAYQGWMRVLVGARPGWRVPVDASSVARSERFVGHFPAGMDMHLPAADGVDELHVSVLARGDDAWAARGLTRERVRVVRALAWVDLSYDPDLPAPLETPLHSEDLVQMGPDAVVELVVLPREVRP